MASGKRVRGVAPLMVQPVGPEEDASPAACSRQFCDRARERPREGLPLGTLGAGCPGSPPGSPVDLGLLLLRCSLMVLYSRVAAWSSSAISPPRSFWAGPRTRAGSPAVWWAAPPRWGCGWGGPQGEQVSGDHWGAHGGMSLNCTR